VYDKIKQRMNDLGYSFFEGYLNVNVVYIRMKNYRLNRFDDYGYVLWQDELGRPVTLQRPVTTRPGKKWLNSPINARGTAILVPGQYRSCYQIDLHNGKYEALCQRKGKVKVYRDNNLDDEFNYDPLSIEEGYFGINCHKAGWSSDIVDGWSAGCQVDQYAFYYDIFMSTIKKSAKVYGNSFTLTLLNEW
jgi:hypothetical protein